MGELSAEAVLSRYRAAQSRRSPWESLWQDCYTFALPQRGSGFGSQFDPARRHAERLFDGTATATEVLERSNEMSRLLGATYGRLQTELLTPLISQGMRILRRRGEIPDIVLDGRTVSLQYRSPLARSQARDDVQNTLLWLETSAQLGPEAMQAVDVPATTRWLAERLGVPGQLVRDLSPVVSLLGDLVSDQSGKE